jgi:hypothetical protein
VLLERHGAQGHVDRNSLSTREEHDPMFQREASGVGKPTPEATETRIYILGLVTEPR